MSNFVTDMLEPPFKTGDLNPIPAGADPGKFLSFSEWNTVMQYLVDLRGVLVNGLPLPLLFFLRTDSNGMGPPTQTDQDDPADNVTVPNTNVVETKMYTDNFTEPVTSGHVFNMGTGNLRVQGFSPAHGPELALGKALNDLINGPGSTPDNAHKVWLDQFSIHSSLLSQWQQGSSAGTSSPLLGGGNLDADSNARALTAVSVSGRRATCMFTMLGTNEGSDGTASANAGTNTTAFIARQRAILGSQLLIVWVVPQSTLPIGTYPNKATARANQIAALTAATGTAQVYAEDLPTSDDLVHFVSIAEQVLGTRMAFAYWRLAGLRERVVTAPTVVGFSVATYNGSAHGLCGITGTPGTDIRIFPWQGSADQGPNGRDLMIAPVFTGFIGAGSPIPTPSGWTLQGSQIASTDGAGVGNHVALFTKQLLQSELDGNNGFPLSPTLTPGGAQFVCKPFTVRAPGGAGFPAFDGVPVAFTHTVLDTSAVTAGGVTTSAAGRTVFILVTAWGNLNMVNGFTVTNAGLTGLTQVYGAAYPSSSTNYLYIGLWTGTLAGSGSSGNSTVTHVAGTPACSKQGYTWAM